MEIVLPNEVKKYCISLTTIFNISGSTGSRLIIRGFSKSNCKVILFFSNDSTV